MPPALGLSVHYYLDNLIFESYVGLHFWSAVPLPALTGGESLTLVETAY